MERYFKLMNYPTDIWVDVIATRVTNSTQVWLDKPFRMSSLGSVSPRAFGVSSNREWVKCLHHYQR